MQERPKFDMGLSELAHSPESESTELEYFRKGDTNDLYTALGYIWRQQDKTVVATHLAPVWKDEVDRGSDEAFLRSVATIAEKEFNILKSNGIPFYGKFLVHDVNETPHLVAAVPLVPDKLEKIDSFIDQDWRNYAQSFLRLYSKLLTYYDNRQKNNRPILFDVSRREQYVYGYDPVTNTDDLILIDPDFRSQDDSFDKEFFLRHGIAAIVMFLKQLRETKPQIYEDMRQQLEDLQGKYRARFYASRGWDQR